MGADAAFSIERPDGRTLWFFNDTIVAAPDQVRSGSEKIESERTTIANSVAVSHCEKEKDTFLIDYHWQISSALKYEPIFQPKHLSPKYSYWPSQPWFYHGYLFVPLRLIERGRGDAGFRVVATHIARVINPEADPTLWKIAYGILANYPEMSAGVGVVQDGDYIHLFNESSVGMVLSRVRPADALGSLHSLSEKVEYLYSDGSWHSEFSAASVSRLPLKATSGLSVRYLPNRKQWMALYADFNVFPAAKVSVSFSDTLTSGWKKPMPLYEFPLSSTTSNSFNPSAFCFAALEHLKFNPSPEKIAAFTFTCGDYGQISGSEDPSILYPQFVRVTLPG